MAFVAIAGVCPAQVVPVNGIADLASLLGASLLIEPEVDPAIDARVVDISGDLLEL